MANSNDMPGGDADLTLFYSLWSKGTNSSFPLILENDDNAGIILAFTIFLK